MPNHSNSDWTSWMWDRDMVECFLLAFGESSFIWYFGLTDISSSVERHLGKYITALARCHKLSNTSTLIPVHTTKQENLALGNAWDFKCQKVLGMAIFGRGCFGNSLRILARFFLGISWKAILCLLANRNCRIFNTRIFKRCWGPLSLRYSESNNTAQATVINANGCLALDMDIVWITVNTDLALVTASETAC